ncbi:35676_t:CDS:1, partial [Racocetra persica]
LKSQKKIPKTYLANWELLQQWLTNPILKIQVEYLIKFGKQVYEPMMNFLISSDKEPRILQPDGQLTPLFSSCRAHEMSDAIVKWIGNLYRVRDNICSLFDKELCDAIDIFDKEDFGNFFNNLEAGIDTAINSLDK